MNEVLVLKHLFVFIFSNKDDAEQLKDKILNGIQERRNKNGL